MDLADEGRNKSIYLCGPMTGYEDFNRPAFHAMADVLKAEGYTVLNPATIEIPGGEWADYMKAAIQRLLVADMVLVLPGWQKSKGARLEIAIAHSLGYKVVSYPHMNVELIENVEQRIARTYDGLWI